jgi:CO dehydrogenase maturation factor
MKIAITGKGGVGKTFVAASLAHSFARQGYLTIAIDADPTPNLALSLGVPLQETHRIIPVSENKALIDSKTGTGYPGVYALNYSVDDIVRNFSIVTPEGVNLLVMGTVKSMGAGCTCAANSIVRTLLRHLVVERDETVILDMEAGLEHLGRGTADAVDCMLVVTDANAKSLYTAQTISHLAQNSGIPHIILIGNKIQTTSQKNTIRRFAKEHRLFIAGFVPFDTAVEEAGIAGDPVGMLKGSSAMRAINRIGRSIMKHPRT